MFSGLIRNRARPLSLDSAEVQPRTPRDCLRSPDPACLGWLGANRSLGTRFTPCVVLFGALREPVSI